MNDILSSLYNCAMEHQPMQYLTRDELRDYNNALHLEEQLEGQLEALLKEEPLRLFGLYVNQRNDEGGIVSISSFRAGLSMGLKLGTFTMLER